MSFVRVILCVGVALILHAAAMLFGGFFFNHDEDASSRRDIELVIEDMNKDAEDVMKDEPKEELKTETDTPPDPNQVVALDEPVSSDEPAALEALSIAAIEAALNGASSGGDDGFGGGGSAGLTSGGVIGGKGKAGGNEEEFADAFSPSQIDQRPRAVYQVAAGYPSELRSQALEGVVTVIFIVDENGRVVNPKVVKSTHSAFEAPALDALRQWKFEPAMKSGNRVACRMRVPIRFQPTR